MFDATAVIVAGERPPDRHRAKTDTVTWAVTLSLPCHSLYDYFLVQGLCSAALREHRRGKPGQSDLNQRLMSADHPLVLHESPPRLWHSSQQTNGIHHHKKGSSLHNMAAAPDTDALFSLKQLAERLAAKGFVCVHCDIDLPKPHEVPGVPQSSESLMKHFESGNAATTSLSTCSANCNLEFVSCLSQSPSPFPPVIFARGPGSLIAQTFISSHRAGGMFLISPPASNADVPDHLLPTPLPEFDFEMKFPIALMGTAEEIEKLQQHRDLTKTGYVDTYIVDVIDEDTVLLKAEEWLDELNI